MAIDKKCIFCKIIGNQIPSMKLFEDGDCIAIAPKTAEAKGHILIMPKEHYENVFDIPEKELREVMLSIKDIANRLKNNWNIQGINLLHASGNAAQQSVPHFHIHLIPRFKNDGIDAWPKFEYEDKNRDQIYKEIMEALK